MLVVNAELMSFGYQRAVSSCWVRYTDQAEPFVVLKALSFEGLKAAVRRTSSSQGAENKRAEVFVRGVKVPGLC